MPSERRYTRNDRAVQPQLERLAHVADRFEAAPVQGETSWQVLARIPEIGVATSRATRARTVGTSRLGWEGEAPAEPAPSGAPGSAGASPSRAALPSRKQVAYRADQSHAAIVAPAWTRTNEAVQPLLPQQTKSLTSSDLIRSLPMAVRVAVQTWEAVQPYKPLLRMIAMFALMAAGGMSMMVMMGGGLKKGETPADATTAAVPAASATDGPAIPDTSTTSDAPTAFGPGRPIGGTMAVAKPVIGNNASPYPTTSSSSYPTFALPPSSSESLPQIRTNESAASVARLQGTIEAVQTR